MQDIGRNTHGVRDSKSRACLGAEGGYATASRVQLPDVELTPIRMVRSVKHKRKPKEIHHATRAKTPPLAHDTGKRRESSGAFGVAGPRGLGTSARCRAGMRVPLHNVPVRFRPTPLNVNTICCEGMPADAAG